MHSTVPIQPCHRKYKYFLRHHFGFFDDQKWLAVKTLLRNYSQGGLERRILNGHDVEERGACTWRNSANGEQGRKSAWKEKGKVNSWVNKTRKTPMIVGSFPLSNELYYASLFFVERMGGRICTKALTCSLNLTFAPSYGTRAYGGGSRIMVWVALFQFFTYCYLHEDAFSEEHFISIHENWLW